MSPDGSGTITEIETRKNVLIRPPVSNLDYMVIVISTVEPIPNYLVIDKFLATMEAHRIKTIIAVSKPDLANPNEIEKIYKKAGYKIFIVNNNTGEGVSELSHELENSLSAFAGNTGTGKSSLLNALNPNLDLPVGETSKKLGRGKHTTRHVEIFKLPNELRVADTPGFSSMDIIETTEVSIKDLDQCFIDFLPYITECKFNDCKHLSESGCKVKKAVEDGIIGEIRYQNYKQIYAEIKDVKEWERN